MALVWHGRRHGTWCGFGARAQLALANTLSLPGVSTAGICMAKWVAALYLLCHALAIVLWPAQATLLSFLMLAGAPLLAAAACLWRSRSSLAPSSWWALAAGMVLWSAGMLVNFYQEVGLGNVDAIPGLSMLFYVLYGVPLTYALASPRQDPWFVRVIDGLLALLLGYQFFVHTFSFATVNATGQAGLAPLRLMFDIENSFIAVFALIRCIASEDAGRRAFFRALALYAWVYLLMAAYINHYETYGSFGRLQDLVIDLPFLLLLMLALRPQPRLRARVWRRLALVVRVGGPLILPLSLLVVSSLLVERHPGLAVVGFSLATAGTGLRSVLTQVRALEQQDALHILARVDPLTGVANRRQFHQTLQGEWNRARRAGQGMAMLLIDIDNFKALNDAYGHPVGDHALRTVADTLAGLAQRSSDLVARYGGEEFAVVIAATPLDGVMALAERMRAAVEELADPTFGPVTVSIGVGLVEQVVEAAPDALIAAADTALYQAKHNGRNRVAQRQL